MTAIYFFAGLKIFELHKYVTITKTSRVKEKSLPTHFVTG